MGNFDDAKRFNCVLLEKEPTNLQAISLDQLIESAIKREGYIGMALTGGAIAAATVIAAGVTAYFQPQ
jgi:fission 1 protein